VIRHLALAAIVALAAAPARPAAAHQAMSGWSYPYECCSGVDCAELAPAAIRETPDGYLVTVVPGGHPMWPVTKPGPLQLAVPYRDARPSPDGRFHLCIDQTGKRLCFFAAIGGS